MITSETTVDMLETTPNYAFRLAHDLEPSFLRRLFFHFALRNPGVEPSLKGEITMRIFVRNVMRSVTEADRAAYARFKEHGICS